MATLHAFLRQWFGDGEISFSAAPERSVMLSQHAEHILWRAWNAYALTLPKGAPDFHLDTALTASELMRFVCWNLLAPGAEEEEIATQLAYHLDASDPRIRFSTDLLFRALPTLLARARQRQPRSPLTLRLEALAREWPLSGVLTRLTPGPLIAPNFDDCECSALLYAERFLEHSMPEWQPEGLAAEYVEWGMSRG